MPPPHVCTAFLRPPLGPCLALRQGETWIGRGSFEASQSGQLLCSRRQAVIQNNGETGLRLECHGCNPLYFVVCQSANFFATQTTPVAELYQLKKGEAVELIDGDQFYFIATECLLTVFIKQHDAALCQELSSQVVSPQIPPPTIEQLRQCSALVTTSVSGIQPEDVQIQATTNSDIENGKSVPPDLCPGDRKTLSSSHAVCLGQGQMMQMAVDRCVVETVRINDRSIESTLSKDVATSVYGIQPEDVQIQATTNPDIENGNSVPPDLCPGERETLSSSHVVCLGQGQMMQMAVDRRGEDSMRMDDRSVESTLLEDVAPYSWPAGPVEGMEDVIASISGYSGHDRSNLIKLIYKTGGAYTGGVSAANTHLVCWNFSGKKFEIAKQQRKLLINHRWFEDCLLLGRRLPEEKYTFRSGEELGPLRWRESPGNMGIETAEYSGKKMKESVNKEAAVGRGECNEQIQDTNSELLGLLHLHQDTNDGANSGQYRQSLYSAVHSLPDHVSPPSGQAELTPAMVAPNRSRTSLKMVKDADLDQRMNGPLASVLEGPLRREPLASGSSSKRAKIVQRGAKVSVGVLEHGHASSVPGRREFVAHSRRRKLRRLARGIESYCTEQSPTTAGAEIPIRMESTSTGTCVDRARVSSSRQEKSNGGLEVIDLGDDDDDGEDAGPVDHYPGKPGTQSIECDKMKDRSFNAEVSCAICLTEAKSCSEGLLGCGHRFCFLCIFKWADEASKGPTCPLCKASFDIITMQENTSPSNSPGRSAASLLKEKVVLVGDKTSLPAFGRSTPIVVESVCIVCGSSDTAEMLVQCSGCGDRACHTFCLDPPAPPPWFCSRCTQGRRRLSMRDAWGQVLPTASTGVSPPRTYGRLTSHGRRWSRFQQPYAGAQLAHQESTLYRSSNRDMIHTRPSSRRVTGQHSLHSWLQPGS